jgi:hypothetical protein
MRRPMYKTMIIAAAAAFSCALAFGQGPSVVLQNHENTTFYYVVDPRELAGLSAGSPLMASTVAGYFSATGDGAAFSALPPQAETRLAGLAVGAHLLVGFFAPADSDDLPVRVLALQADSSLGERYYGIFASPAQLTVHRGVGRLAQFPRSGSAEISAAGTAPDTQAGAGSRDTDGGKGATHAEGSQPGTRVVQSAADSSTLPVIATFAAVYDPVVFTRETREGFAVLPISESRSWKQTGTRIASVQGTVDSAGLKLVLNVRGGFSPSVSYFLYVFDTRSAGTENPLTLEIEPLARGDRGACILWQKGTAAPRLFGTVKTGETSLEVDVSADELGSGAFVGAGSAPTVDLTAAWYDKALGMWEEFYYTTFPGPALGAKG